jgi:hypothetical protein
LQIRIKPELLRTKLAAHGNVLGIVNKCRLCQNERIDALDLRVFTAVMDLNVRPALQLTQALLPVCDTHDLPHDRLFVVDPTFIADLSRETIENKTLYD